MDPEGRIPGPMIIHVPSGGGEEQKENGSGPRWCHHLQQDTQKAWGWRNEESAEAEGTSTEIRIWNLGAAFGPELEVVRTEMVTEIVGADASE